MHGVLYKWPILSTDISILICVISKDYISYVTYNSVIAIFGMSIKITGIVIDLTFIDIQGVTGTTDVAGGTGASDVQFTDPTNVFICHAVYYAVLSTVIGLDVEGKAMMWDVQWVA